MREVEVLGLTSWTWLLATLVVVLYALVIWMLLEIIFRADFSGGMTEPESPRLLRFDGALSLVCAS